MPSTFHRTSGSLRVASRRGVRVEDDNNGVKTVDQLLTTAEQSFVRNDFSQALHLANQVLVKETHAIVITPPPEMTPIPLKTNVPYLDDVYKLSLLFDGDVSRADRAGAIVLQSHQNDSEPALKAFLTYYSTHAIPMDLFSIFVQFLLQHDDAHRQTALELATEALYHIITTTKSTAAIENDGNSATVQEVTDEIVWTFCTRMLPYCPNGVDVLQHFMTTNGGNDDDGVELTANWKSEPVPFILDSLPRVIDSLRGVASDDCLKRCRERVQEMKGVDDKISETTSSALVGNKKKEEPPIDRWNSNGGRPNSHRKDWYRILSTRLLRAVRERIVPLLFSKRNRGEVAVTVLSLYIAWKQRQRLYRSGGAIAGLLLAPFRELLEAAAT